MIYHGRLVSQMERINSVQKKRWLSAKKMTSRHIKLVQKFQILIQTKEWVIFRHRRLKKIRKIFMTIG